MEWNTKVLYDCVGENHCDSCYLCIKNSFADSSIYCVNIIALSACARYTKEGETYLYRDKRYQ